MDRARQDAVILDENSSSPTRGGVVLTLMILGAAVGCVPELLGLAWPGETWSVGGWSFLHRMIRGAMGMTLGLAVCYGLTRDKVPTLQSGIMGAFLASWRPASPDLGWLELLGSVLTGLILGGSAGLGGVLVSKLSRGSTAKAKAAADPFDGL